MPSPSENVYDSAASVALATWLQEDKVDTGPALTEADTPTYVAAIWGNGVDKFLKQVSEILDATSQATALDLTGDIRVGGQAFINNAAGTANISADDLVIGDTGGTAANYGLTIFADNTGVGHIYYGDATSSTSGRIDYDHNNTRMRFYAEETLMMQVNSASVFPGVDSSYTFGTSSVRWGTSYIDTGIFTDQVTVNNAAGTAHTTADDLVIGDTGGTGGVYGLTILSDATGASSIHAGDGADNDVGKLSYDHVNNRWGVTSNATLMCYLQSNGIRPGLDSTYNLGQVTFSWANSYIDTGIFTDQVKVNNAAGTASSLGDDLVVGTTGDAADHGLTIFTDAANVGRILFGDAVSPSVGQIDYQHSADRFLFVAGGTTSVLLSAAELRPNVDGGTDLGTTSVRWGTTYTDAAVVTDTLQVNNAAGTPSTLADELVLGGTAQASSGATFFSTNTGAGYLMWGDSDDADVGIIQYQHTGDQFVITANAVASLIIDDANLRPFTANNMSVGSTANYFNSFVGLTHRSHSDGTGTVGTDAVRFAAGFIDAFTVTDSIEIDSGTSPTFDMVKGAATTGVQRFRTVSGADTAGDKRALHDASEVLHMSHYNGTTWDDVISIGANQLGFFGVSPASQSASYGPSNVTTDRVFDADSTTLAEIADVLGTLIIDLQALGLLGA